jgi:hypothetical protein
MWDVATFVTLWESGSLRMCSVGRPTGPDGTALCCVMAVGEASHLVRTMPCWNIRGYPILRACPRWRTLATSCPDHGLGCAEGDQNGNVL